MHRIILSAITFLPGAIMALIPVIFTQPFNNAEGLTSYQKLARDIFRELIEINTTVNNGSTKAAEAMAARLRTAGFPDSDLQLIGPRPENKNLVVRYRGEGTKRPILFIAHLDVVEARRDDWSFDPFTFTERDGYFYGRGTSDMKCEVADIVANFIRLKKEGFVPNRDIIVALTDDEETGDANGVRWLLATHRSLVDAEYCINLEGGGGDIRNGKPELMEIQASEKVYISFQLEVKNPGGHSSRPVKENAIYRLAAALTRLARFEFPISLNETTRVFFERTARLEAGQLKNDMLAILKEPIDAAAASRLADLSPYHNAMMRTTFVPTMLNAGHAENALPQTARAVVNCRMLPDDNVEHLFSTLKRLVADSLVVITPLNDPFISPPSPLQRDVLETVEGLTASMWPGVLVTPVMSTGSTDGKYLRHEGIPVYGVSGMFTDMDDVRAHGKDERIGVKEFYDGVEFMYGFVKGLTSGS